MENAGAITYRDEMLLVDDGHATIEQKQLSCPRSRRMRWRIIGSETW